MEALAVSRPGSMHLTKAVKIRPVNEYNRYEISEANTLSLDKQNSIATQNVHETTPAASPSGEEMVPIKTNMLGQGNHQTEAANTQSQENLESMNTSSNGRMVVLDNPPTAEVTCQKTNKGFEPSDTHSYPEGFQSVCAPGSPTIKSVHVQEVQQERAGEHLWWKNHTKEKTKHTSTTAHWYK